MKCNVKVVHDVGYYWRAKPPRRGGRVIPPYTCERLSSTLLHPCPFPEIISDDAAPTEQGVAEPNSVVIAEGTRKLLGNSVRA